MGFVTQEFKIDNAGKSQVLQHAKGKVHKDLASSALDNTQSKLRPVNKNLFVINLIWKHLLSTK
jgi:hypothetical protein